MKKLLAIGLLAISLGGCATIKQDWAIVTGTTVSPAQILVAGNAFDAVEITAANYLNWCKANGVASACLLGTRQKVVAAVRAGRAARIQLEPYVTSGTAGPLAIYQTLQAAISTLQTTTPAVGK